MHFTWIPSLPPQEIMVRANGLMSKTRGGAAACARLVGDNVSYAGVGNISGTLVSAGKSQGLVSHNGTLGLHQRRTQQFEYQREPGALLIMHSDGVSARWDLKNRADLLARHPAIIAARLYRDHGRGRDDATVVVVALMSTDLQAQLAAREADIVALREELDETNKGVVALYAELDDKAAELREATELKSRFLSYMSHEFRTPLTSMTSITGILLSRLDGPLTPEQQKQVEFIRGSARELTDMVNDLLDLAKVEAGRITISPEWFEMVDLFAALRGMFKPIVASTSISLVFDEPQGDIKLYTDDKKLSQILRNFISNALKFTPEGEVRVTATLLPDERVEFAVTDTGIGIAAEHLPNLFADFVQLDVRLQKRLRGSGLGLSLARKFAELLGGEVHVAKRARQGFALLGGAADEAAARMRAGGRMSARLPARSPTRRSWWSTTIPRRSIPPRASCAPAGFEVIEATTGTEALAAAEQDIGLIVLDINLPDIDGLEVCRRLRARSTHGLSTHRASDGHLRRARRHAARALGRR